MGMFWKSLPAGQIAATGASASETYVQNGDNPFIRIALENCVELYYHMTFHENARSIVLPNAKVGSPFKAEFDLLNARTNGKPKGVCKIIEQRGFEELGVSCAISENSVLTISGSPNRPFEGRIFFELSDSRTPKDVFPIPWSVVVADPFDLWEKHEPPQDSPYPKEHDVCDGTTLVGTENPLRRPLTVLAARKRGRSHEHVGHFCDDHYAMKFADDGNGWHVFAVADGAGSAKYAREGSRIACETATQELSAFLNSDCCAQTELLCERVKEAAAADANADLYEFSKDDVAKLQLELVITNVLRNAWHKIKAEAVERGVGVRDFHTTLLLVAIKRFEFDATESDAPARSFWAALSYWIGDGALAAYRPNGSDSTRLLGKPDGGEYAGETRFMTIASEIDHARTLERTRLIAAPSFNSIVLMTDGVSDPYFPSDSKLSDPACWDKFWNEVLPREAQGVFDVDLSPPERARRLLKGLEFKVKGSHDDRTILAILDDSLNVSDEIRQP